MHRIVTGIVAHVDAGKTTLSEGILYLTGKIPRPGRVDLGSTHLDSHTLEKARGITIFSSQSVFTVDNTEITLLDTPGHVDFSAEMERALSVLDYAILVVSGTDGVQPHTETLWHLLARYHLPVFVFVTKMDRPNVDKRTLLSDLQLRLSPGCIDFSDPSLEDIALCDESALTSYLETGTLCDQTIVNLIAQRNVFPCFFGSGTTLSGIEQFLHAFARFACSSPVSNKWAARVYKISRDAQNTRLTWLRVYGGTLRVRMPVSYLTPGGEIVEEKISQIRQYTGDKYETTEEAYPGSIYAVQGLSGTRPGQTLGSHSIGPAPLLVPALSYRLLLPSGIDPRIALANLRQLEEEDPLLHVVWDERMHEIRVELMGEIQTEILKSLLQLRFGWQPEMDEGSVMYRETIAAPVEGVGHFEPLRHYAEVHLLLEPAPRGSGLVFESTCHTDVLSQNWQNLVLTHLQEKQHLGVLIGAPVTDMRITLTAGRSHLKHTEGGDFRQATYRAVRQGLMQAQSILLEPYYRFALELPTEFVGRAMGDIQRFNGVYETSEAAGTYTLIRGTAPVAAMRNYTKNVAAYTSGRGRLSCFVEGYQPCKNAADVINAVGYEPERDIENTPDSVFCSHGAGFPVKWHEVPQYMHLERTLPRN